MSSCSAARVYRPRTTASCDAVALVRRHLPAFLERIEQDGGELGVFSNHHALRARIQVQPAAPLAVAPMQVSLFDATGLQPWHTSSLSQTAPRTRARLGWASLLARVFSIDVSVCSRCGGQLRVIAAITDAHEIARLLHGARPPPRSSLAGQLSFFNT